MKIQPDDSQRHLAFGRHFTAANKLYSRISRASIDALKAEFREEVTKSEWRTMVQLKSILGIS